MRKPLDEYQQTERALDVVDRAAASGMKPAEIAVALDVAESTIRMWRKRPETVIDLATAKMLKRLDYRVPKEATR